MLEMGQDSNQYEHSGNFSRNLLLLAALVSLVAGLITGGQERDQGFINREVKKFEKVLHKKEHLLREEFIRLEALFKDTLPMEVLDRRSSRYQDLANSEGISIFYFERGGLKYWSDHSIPLRDRWSASLGKPFISLRNADYVPVVRKMEGGRLLGLIEIRTHFPFQNDFLVNGFHSGFGMDPEAGIEFLESDGMFPVFSDAGAYLFSLDFNKVLLGRSEAGMIPRLCFVLFVVLLYAGLFRIVKDARGIRKQIWMGILTLLLPLTAFLILKVGINLGFERSRLFQPDLFASTLFPSLGHLLTVSLALFALVALYFLHGIQADDLKGGWRRAFALLLMFSATVMLLFTEYLISTLVLDSGISFEAHRVVSFSGYTIVALLIIIMWFVIIGLVLDRAYVCFTSHPGAIFLQGAGVITLTMLPAILIESIPGTITGWFAMLLFLAGLLYLRHYHRSGRIPFSRFFFLLLFMTIFMVIRLQQYNHIKVEGQKEVELVKLSSEHDPVAEMLFEDLSRAIRNDSVLARFMNQPYIDIDPLVNRLSRNYFSGYWTKYDYQITVCRTDDQLYLEPPDDTLLHCYSFFEEMVRAIGIGISGTDFYFLDNQNGRISYLASIPYALANFEHRIFVELDTKILSEELGYPELLLDEQYSAFTPAKFSYARYNNGELVTRNGEYPYRRSSELYTDGVETFEKMTCDRYDHSIFNVDEKNTVIVGTPSVTAMDNLISFSYIFALSFTVLALFYLFFTIKIHRPGFNWNFKNRIRYSMVGILFLTFALICSGTIFFIIQQDRDKNNDNLRNTMRSVYIELIHKVEFEEDLRNWSSDSYYNLDELLRKFSNVFYSDINLYDEQGLILATSRSEIFNRQLLSRRMNRMVYENLAGGRASEVILNEHIGEMRYISAYVPLLNSDNKLLAYLNLPYFTQSGTLTQDVTNMVVAVVNIYLILLLVILGASVFMADRITQPLRMIQSRIAKVSLGEKNEMINYDRSDEIRGLVEEYNYMVQEIERSAELLAQSERESAWREMAKQIAHEIKNPLTPMKLNVQHLQRTMGDEDSDPEMVERISATLIEQIDSLSAIANEFSDFAKMPRAKSGRINLVDKLQHLLQLFGKIEKTEISLDVGSLKKVDVLGDKEQLMRVFINLVKNGMQSIPETRRGIIRIRLEVEDEKARVAVADNGKGIPEGIKDKLFQPNFTTKSAGMGLGLAISYNIVRSMGGEIWYETVIGEGTTFFLELPLMVEKSG